MTTYRRVLILNNEIVWEDFDTPEEAIEDAKSIFRKTWNLWNNFSVYACENFSGGAVLWDSRDSSASDLYHEGIYIVDTTSVWEGTPCEPSYFHTLEEAIENAKARQEQYSTPYFTYVNRRTVDHEHPIVGVWHQKWVTRTWKVHGRIGHRQKASFWKSHSVDLSGYNNPCILDISCSDKTGTNDYVIVNVTCKTTEDCERAFYAQLYDGTFENCDFGIVEEISE